MPQTDQNATALCIGEALIDIFIHPNNSSPTLVPGGSPANVALSLGRLDRPVRLATHMAKDSYGQLIIDKLGASKVQLDPQSFGAEKTSSSQVSVDEHGNPDFTFDFSWDLPTVQIKNTDVVIQMGSIGSTQRPGCQEVLEAVTRGHKQATIVYDPNIRPGLMTPIERTYEQFKALCKVCDVVKVSDADLSALFKSGDLHSMAMKILSWGAKLVIITQGAMGAEAWSSSGATCHVSAVEATVVDTVGCGDAFTAGVIDRLWDWGLLGARNRKELGNLGVEQLESLLSYALLLAGLTISTKGANPPWASDLKK